MTSKEFVLWLKGFTEGVHEFNITPKQWDLLKDKLAEVKDDEPIGFPFGVPNTTPNTHPFPTWQHPHYPNPLDNPFKVTCNTGSFGTTTPGFAITTTPGTGYITTYNPAFSGSYNPSSITYSTGSAWSYTTYSGDMGTIGSKPKTQTDYQKEHSTKFKKRKAKSVKEWEDTHDLGGQE
jgi:hypothetical protein